MKDRASTSASPLLPLVTGQEPFCGASPAPSLRTGPSPRGWTTSRPNPGPSSGHVWLPLDILAQLGQAGARWTACPALPMCEARRTCRSGVGALPCEGRPRVLQLAPSTSRHRQADPLGPASGKGLPEPSQVHGSALSGLPDLGHSTSLQALPAFASCCSRFHSWCPICRLPSICLAGTATPPAERQKPGWLLPPRCGPRETAKGKGALQLPPPRPAVQPRH